MVREPEGTIATPQVGSRELKKLTEVIGESRWKRAIISLCSFPSLTDFLALH